MERAQQAGGRADGSSRHPISVALIAGMAFVPIVVAAGFLADCGTPSPPGDISVAALRGAIDRGPLGPPPAARAGF